MIKAIVFFSGISLIAWMCSKLPVNLAWRLVITLILSWLFGLAVGWIL